MWKLIAGLALEAAAGLAIATGVGAIAAPYLIQAGAGLILSGIGSIIQGNQIKGHGVTTKTPIGIWEVGYGQIRVGGTEVFDNTWGNNLNMRDIVAVLFAHPISTITRMLFDSQFVQMNTTAGYAFPPTPLTGGYSTGPTNGKYNITQITRSSLGVVTVTTGIAAGQSIPFLQAGDQIKIQYDTPGPGPLTTYGLIGSWQVAEITAQSGGYVYQFTFLSGGTPCIVDNQGEVRTLWPNYGTNVYAEWSNGEGVIGNAGCTFVGMVGTTAPNSAGTPWLGTGQLVNPASPGPAGGTAATNPWTAYCALHGFASVFIRLSGNTSLFPSGLPLISFLINGKSDIYDPRLGPCTGVEAGGFSNNGTGYLEGDLLEVNQSGASGCHIQVQSVNNGVISWEIVQPGVGYHVGGPLSTTYVSHIVGSGSGTGATFTISELGGSTGTIGYTANAALCIADFLNDPTWGYNIPYSDTPLTGEYIPTGNLITAADICDESVATVVGGSEPLWSCNGRFDLSQSRGEVLDQLLTSCAGRLTTFGGQYIIWPGVWYGSSPVSYDLIANAAGPFKWRPSVEIRNLFNGVRGTYISPANKWQSTDFPYYAQDYLHGYSGPAQYMGDINLAVDGGQRRWFDMQLKFTISPRQAQQTAKIELLRRRNFGTGTFVCNLSAYQFTPMDIMAATNSFLGWSDYLVEVQQPRFRADKDKGEKGNEATRLTIELDVQQTNSNIYAWSEAEELTPQGYQQVFWPQGFVTEKTCLPWSPGGIAPLAGDALYPSAEIVASPPFAQPPLATFGIEPVIGPDAGGNGTVSLQIIGYCPINDLDTEIEAPQISCTGSTTGGYLADGTYVVAISSRSAGGASYQNTKYQVLGIAVISGGGGNGSINVTIVWGSGDDGGDLYLAALSPGTVFSQFDDTSYTWHWNQFVPFSTGSPPVEVTTATVVVFDQSTPGGPDPYFDHFGITWREVIHGGIWADQIVSVTPTTITIGAPPGITANQFAGYVMTLLGKYDQTAPIPVINLPIASHTATTANEVVYTIGPNSAGVQIADLTTLLGPLDLMMVLVNPTFTANSYTDPNIANPFYPSGASGVEVGHVAVVMTGADKGDVQTIAKVTTTVNPNDTFILSGTWATTPASGDIVIVCTAAQAPQYAASAQTAQNGNISGVMATVPVPNLADQTWLFLVRTEDKNGVYGADALAPMRMLYVWGSGGTRVVSASTTMLPTDGTVIFDGISASVVYTCLPFSQVPNQIVFIYRRNCGANVVTVQAVGGDDFTNGGNQILLLDDLVDYQTVIKIPAQ